MSKRFDRELQRLENHLMADETREKESAQSYNRDRTDVDLNAYSEKVYGKKRGCGIWIFIFLLLMALGVFLFLVLGGELPWK